MKKIMKTILIGGISLLLAFGFAGCNEDCVHVYDNACDVTCNECSEERTITHTWVDADCDTSKTCSVCGATDGNALGHTWVDADCNTSKTCSVCGATEGDALGHSPEEDDGDCTTEVKCTVCDEVTTSAGQHSPEEDDGNCTTAVYCANCDQIVVPAKENHTAIASVANCIDHAICDDCGTSFGELDPNNHKDSETEVHYLDENSHETYYKCCNTVSDTEEHNGKPTCNSYGYCTICEMAYAEPDPDNHASTETYVIGIDDEKHGIYYSCCQTLKEEAGHTVQRSATCNQKASCADCGNEFGAFDPNNHAISETSISWISDESHEERYLCCNTVVKTEPHNGKASCMHVAYCTTCGQNYGDYDMTNHESEEFIYESAGPGAHTKFHACCRTVSVLTEACSGGTATCTSGKICDFCEIEYSDVDSANHASGNYTDNGDGTHSISCQSCNHTTTEEHLDYIDKNCQCAKCGIEHYLVYADEGQCWCLYCDEDIHNPDENCVCTICSLFVHKVDTTTGICSACNDFIAAASITVDGVKTYYSTFEEAIDYANGKDSTVIVIENDCNIMDAFLKISSGSITIDLNGKTVDSMIGYSMPIDGASVTIRDSVGGGKTLETVGGWSGTLMIEGGTHSYVSNPQNLVITGGKFTVVDVNKGKTTISGGSFEKIGIHRNVGTLSDMLADGYCFYDKDGNVVDVSTIQTDEYGWYYLNDVTVGIIK